MKVDTVKVNDFVAHDDCFVEGGTATIGFVGLEGEGRVTIRLGFHQLIVCKFVSLRMNV